MLCTNVITGWSQLDVKYKISLFFFSDVLVLNDIINQTAAVSEPSTELVVVKQPRNSLQSAGSAISDGNATGGTSGGGGGSANNNSERVVKSSTNLKVVQN